MFGILLQVQGPIYLGLGRLIVVFYGGHCVTVGA